MEIGARYQGDGKCSFKVWAPFCEKVGLKIIYPAERIVQGKRDSRGYWTFDEDGIFPNATYFYWLDGTKFRPDPASRYQPESVHGPSQVVDHEYPWRDKEWNGIPLKEMIIYELHTGTFTAEGTFEAVIPRLEGLFDLGITALEIMPVGQFPGRRNWGYDGVYPFAVQNSYGGPRGLKKLVDASHTAGLAVILDVVYNHLGPEGNYFADYGPYFTDKYKTPWGRALNFDGAFSDEVRAFFFENALAWFRDYHLDALRLDAVHAIWDTSAMPFLHELAEKVKEFSHGGRRRYLIAESDLNDVRVIDSHERNGFGIDAQWSDDLHHALHALLTGERDRYYQDFGSIEDLASALSDGFVYSWRYSKYRKRHHGSSSREFPPERFIVSSQNHDQVGNRPFGERLSQLISFEALKLAAGAVILSPCVPLIFMGEEYAEEAPFLYFVSHSDPELIEATRAGRRMEFKAGGENHERKNAGKEIAKRVIVGRKVTSCSPAEGNFSSSSDEPPDPQDPETFFRSQICWQDRAKSRHRVMLNYYRQLIRMRKGIPALRNLSKDCQDVYFDSRLIFVRRWHASSEALCIMNFGENDTALRLSTPGNSRIMEENFSSFGAGVWKKVIDSSDTVWGGPGSSMPDMILQSENGLIRWPEKYQIRHQSFLLYEKREH